MNRSGLEPRNFGRVLHMKHSPPPKKPLNDDPRFLQAVQNYEAGLRALQERKYEKARQMLQKVIASGHHELCDRANVHLNTCNQHIDRTAAVFKTPEEHFDYAISLMNMGDYIVAREHLEKLAKQVPKADYVQYGLAALTCLTNHPEDSLRYLAEAIQLNAGLRFQARNDSDFQNLFEDPRFTELLYPETGGDVAAHSSPSEGE
jgi:tetratricopeptide (TPR) repeat protein